MKTIYINNKDLGFFTQTPITVQRFDEPATACCGDGIDESGRCLNCKEPAEMESELIWCNHAQAEEEEVENTIYHPDMPDIVWTNKIMVCKCGAYRFIDENRWYDAPFEGSHHD